ncbi:cold-shock protein [Kitasatospora sp. NPDC008050]|uniref:cold-shock protein n=1 Tax=Kitasatospora sp. NPDC008050 TaxID=3364021 RepID=UPI0036E206B1
MPVAAAPQDRVPPGLHRSTGIVKWFNPEKGFGFITPDEPGPDLFAHYSEIEATGFRELIDGQRVEFETSKGPKGPQADRIRPVVDRPGPASNTADLHDGDR